MNVWRNIVAAGLALALCGASGCVLGNRPTLVRTGTRADEVTFYLDGAGNYGFGKESVPLGLADGGYEGHVQHYIWTTYLGPVLDQVYLSHNRNEGRQLAQRIEEHLDRYPTGRVNLIALSAGTGVAVFALESLRPTYFVDNVVLLSSSLSSGYDLTTALQRVRGGIYFFWSPDDPILEGFVPIIGTVDRTYDSTPAGIWGARLPRGASEETRELYRRHVFNRRWSPSAIRGPFKLQHAGSISRSVIQKLVAPILVAGPTTPAQTGQPAQKPPAPTMTLPPRTQPGSVPPSRTGPAPTRPAPRATSRPIRKIS